MTGQNATDLDERILYKNLVNLTYLDKSIRDIHLQPGGSQEKLSWVSRYPGKYLTRLQQMMTSGKIIPCIIGQKN